MRDDTLKAGAVPTTREPGSDLLDFSLLAADPGSDLGSCLNLWRDLREQIKPRLEAAIKLRSEREYPTFEDKVAVVKEINEVVAAWVFRAVNPATGRAAYLRVRQQESHPNGQFYFQEIKGSEVVATPKPESPTHTVALPAFALTSAPPDPRATQ